MDHTVHIRPEFSGLGSSAPDVGLGQHGQGKPWRASLRIDCSFDASLAIATLTISINLIVDDISAHTGGKLSNRMI